MNQTTGPYDIFKHLGHCPECGAKADYEKVLKKIVSGECPPPYPMTERGLLDYHVDLARAALGMPKS